jgi:serine/threonine protein kinase
VASSIQCEKCGNPVPSTNDECPACLLRLGLEDPSHTEPLSAPADESLAAGTVLGPYRIEALIGTGGMGRVYRALDTRLNRRVAIKISAERFFTRGSPGKPDRLQR